jgi:FkbM family methyltransferase
MLRIVRHSAIKLAQRFGYTIVPNWRLEDFQTVRFLRRLFDLLEIDCVVDVGANRGQYKEFLRQEVGYDGQVISFEPIPEHAALLREKARRDPKWIVNGYALGHHHGTSEFNIMAGTQLSSFLNPTHDVVGNFRGKNEIRAKVRVEVKTLDEVLPEYRDLGLKNLYLKLDTQGFDLEVIRGAANTLKSFRALQTEASVLKLYEGMPRYDEVIRDLENRGFVMSGIFPNNAGHFPLLIEFDCYLINRAFAPAYLAQARQAAPVDAACEVRE